MPFQPVRLTLVESRDLTELIGRIFRLDHHILAIQLALDTTSLSTKQRRRLENALDGTKQEYTLLFRSFKTLLNNRREHRFRDLTESWNGLAVKLWREDVATLCPSIMQRMIDKALLPATRELKGYMAGVVAGDREGFHDKGVVADCNLVYTLLDKRIDEWRHRLTKWAKDRNAELDPELGNCRRHLRSLRSCYRGILSACKELLSQ